MAERFWAKVNKCICGCWHWTGGKCSGGYGSIGEGGRGGRILSAHRVAWFLEQGEYPKEHVLHTCDHPACVNPAHLFLGTHQDNMDDCRKKGRVARGEKMPRAKLTAAQVLEIRERSANGEPHRRIANVYRIGKSQVGRIVLHQEWAHV